MLEQDRGEPVTISLPLNYQGKTLTIAQSTSPISETFSSVLDVFPCHVTLYCGYAYESKLIAENSQSSILSTMIFCISILLLVIFVYKTFQNQFDIGILCMALTILLQIANILQHTTFFSSYFGIPTFDFAYHCNHLSFVVLLFFLSNRGGRYRNFLYSTTILSLLSALHIMFYSMQHDIATYLLHLLTSLFLIGFLSVLLLGFLFWRKENTFYRFFTPIVLVGIVLLFFINFLSFEGDTWIGKLKDIIKIYSADAFLTQLRILMLCVGFVIIIMEFFKQEIEKRTEQKLLVEYSKLAQTNYENLRQHQKQIMMLHHDMNKHLAFLQQMTTEENVSSYLEELVGQQAQILPIIQSGNDMLDVILNGKLNNLYETNVNVEVERANAPKQMPLSDTDFCSLIINIMDNALHAVTKYEIKQPYLFLDLHIKNDFWIFTCKNSVSMNQTAKKIKKETIQMHGFGLHIIEKITKQYNAIYQTESGTDFYQVTLAIPLSQSSK